MHNLKTYVVNNGVCTIFHKVYMQNSFHKSSVLTIRDA